jgi:tRNA1Val (adenine37-N6)-methyltransferase
MSNTWFQFKQFVIHQDRTAMKVTTDACLFGAFAAEEISKLDPSPHRILDIGTGTGLLPLMIAQKNPVCDIDAIELDKEAYGQATQNVAESKFAGTIKIIHGNATTYNFETLYDIIISNPPFYENELKGSQSNRNMAHHNEGLLLKELMTIIKSNLAPGGIFFILLPFKRSDDIKKLILENTFNLLQIVFVRQSVNHDYFRIMLTGRSLFNPSLETKIQEISITDANRKYTAEFVDLLGEYYLDVNRASPSASLRRPKEP